MIHQIHTADLQLSYREIFIFLNIPGKDLTGSFTILQSAHKFSTSGILTSGNRHTRMLNQKETYQAFNNFPNERKLILIHKPHRY